MIVAALLGGVGNQLFQYATARALALRLGVPVGLDRRWFQGPKQRDYALDRFAIADTPVDPHRMPARVGKLSARLEWGSEEEPAGALFDWSKTHLDDALLGHRERARDRVERRVEARPLHQLLDEPALRAG